MRPEDLERMKDAILKTIDGELRKVGVSKNSCDVVTIINIENGADEERSGVMIAFSNMSRSKSNRMILKYISIESINNLEEMVKELEKNETKH